MWEMAKQAGAMIFLALGSAQDIREQKISVRTLILWGILFFSLSLAFDGISCGERVENMLPGIAAFALAFLTGEQIGYGDAACLIVLGNVLTAASLCRAVMGGLLFFSLCSLALLSCKKARRGTTLPFLPFLAAGTLWQIITWNGGGL